MIKRTLISDLEVSRNNKSMSLMNLKEDDEIVDSCIVSDEDEIMILSADGYSSRYAVSLIAPTSCKGKGVIAMKNDACMALIKTEVSQFVCITQSGAMKRLKTSEIALTGRPVRGELIAKKVKSNPQVIRYAFGCENNDEILIMSEKCECLHGRDVALMSKDATYSNAIKLPNPFYLQKKIQTVMKIDKKEKKEEDVQVEINQTSLFD